MPSPQELLEVGPRIVVSLSPDSDTPNKPVLRELTGIINTASEVTWVDRPRLNQLKLQPVDEEGDSIPWFNGEAVEVFYFFVRVGILTNEKLAEHPIRVAAADLRAIGCQVVIGRNLLQYYEFIYDGTKGTFTLRRLLEA